MYSHEQLETAQKRLRDNPALTYAVVASLKSSQEMARHDHPIGWAALDAELKAAMVALGRLMGAEQLLLAEQYAAHFAMRAAEAHASAESLRAVAREQAHQARLAGQREASRAAWVAQTGKGVSVAISTLRERLDRLNERLGAASSESDIRAVADMLADHCRAAITTCAVEQRESLRRESAANVNATAA